LNRSSAFPIHHPDRGAALVGVTIDGRYGVGDPFSVGRTLRVRDILSSINVVNDNRPFGLSIGPSGPRATYNQEREGELRANFHPRMVSETGTLVK
jgi:hypothetical protein